MPRDRQHLFTKPGLDGLADAVRQGRLEVDGGLRERLDLVTRPLERRLGDHGVDPAFRSLSQPLVRAFDRDWIHGRQR